MAPPLKCTTIVGFQVNHIFTNLKMKSMSAIKKDDVNKLSASILR